MNSCTGYSSEGSDDATRLRRTATHTVLDSAGVAEDSGTVFATLRDGTESAAVEEIVKAEPFKLPGADLSDEQLPVRGVPQQADEFRCSSCFLLHHRNRYAGHRDGVPICQQCAS